LTTPADAPAPGGARRIALNSAIQAAGEAGSKVAMLALYAVMARRLGQDGFGDFTSAASLALFVMVAGFGTDYTVTRLVARGDATAGEAFWDAVVLKLALGTLGVAAVLAVALAGPYDPAVVQATALLGAAMVLDLVTMSLQATFRGVERMAPIAQGQLLQRFAIAVAGAVALGLGGSLVAVAAIWLAGSAGAVLYAAVRARRMRLTFPAPATVRLARLRHVLLDSYGLGLGAVFGAVMSRLDLVLLGIMKTSGAVALYGAAYRLFESTFVLTSAFALASFPALSRLSRDTTPTIGAAHQQAITVVMFVMAPVAVLFATFAAPMAETMYGADFAGAASAIRWLSGAVVLFGFFTVTGAVLASQGRQGALAAALGAGALINLALNLVLIPAYASDGAAAAMTASLLLTDAILFALAVRATGPLSAARIAAGPLVAAGAMAAVPLGLGDDLVLVPVALAAYALVLVLVERRVFPDDLRLMLGALRRRPAAA
jgi:O-antigen/teichoic acid export membrane protein